MMISDQGKHLILLIVRLMSNEYRILISLDITQVLAWTKHLKKSKNDSPLLKF